MYLSLYEEKISEALRTRCKRMGAPHHRNAVAVLRLRIGSQRSISPRTIIGENDPQPQGDEESTRAKHRMKCVVPDCGGEATNQKNPVCAKCDAAGWTADFEEMSQLIAKDPDLAGKVQVASPIQPFSQP
jgi:hypothetical protein